MAVSVLHISNGFLGLSKVHRMLYQSIDQLEVKQTIFAVIRKNKNIRKETEIAFLTPDSGVLYSRMLKFYHKFLFRSKSNYLYNDIKRQVNFNEVQVVHATTLFTDGALALRVFKEFNKPYIVTVRNTDINVFLNYRKDLYFLVHEILENAQKIIFISDAYKNNLFEHKLIRSKKYSYLKKSVVINNGIDEYWLSHLYHFKKETPNKILFVGRLSKEKNIARLIEAVIVLRKKIENIQLTIIGDLGNDAENVLALIKNNVHFINYVGFVDDKRKLIEIYREHHIFAMPSLKETFGLVYIEALTQGLPVLFTKKQGIDGCFTDLNIGEAVNASSVQDIAEGLNKIILNYNHYDIKSSDFTRFSWKNIANSYLDIYTKV